MEKFRIFANGWAGITIAHLENVYAKKLLILRNVLKLNFLSFALRA